MIANKEILMYSTKKALESNKKTILTKESILERMNEFSLFRKYIGDFKIGQPFNSPIRKDKNPSFCIFHSKKFNTLYFMDYGSGEGGDVFSFLSLLWNIPFRGVLTRLNEEIGNGIQLNTIKTYNKDCYNRETNIGVVRQEWTEIDKEYWNKYGISLKTLKKFNVSSIKYYLQDGIVKGIYKDNCPMYAYKIFAKFKIYRPLGNKYIKWRCNTSKDDIQGYEQLPKKGDLLIITKSLKDIMSLYELGYTAISPASESTNLPDECLTNLKERFKTILIFFDRDITGIEKARKLMKKTGLRPITLSKKHKAKDISDYISLSGIEAAREIMKELTTIKQSKYNGTNESGNTSHD